MTETPMGYAEYATWETHEHAIEPHGLFWLGGSVDDKDEIRFEVNKPLIIDPRSFPVGTRIIVYVPVDEQADADWPGF